MPNFEALFKGLLISCKVKKKKPKKKLVAIEKNHRQAEGQRQTDKKTDRKVAKPWDV